MKLNLHQAGNTCWQLNRRVGWPWQQSVLSWNNRGRNGSLHRLLGLVPENLELDHHHQNVIKDDNIAHYGLYTLRSRWFLQFSESISVHKLWIRATYVFILISRKWVTLSKPKEKQDYFQQRNREWEVKSGDRRTDSFVINSIRFEKGLSNRFECPALTWSIANSLRETKLEILRRSRRQSGLITKSRCDKSNY